MTGPGTAFKLPLPPHDPIDGALVIDPGEATKRLGDDLDSKLRRFLQQTLPGIHTDDLQSSKEHMQLASHYRTTYGQMEPVHKKGRPVRYAGIGNAGSIGDTFRQMRSIEAEALNESEKGAGGIGGNIEDSNFFTHMQNVRRFLGRHEK